MNPESVGPVKASVDRRELTNIEKHLEFHDIARTHGASSNILLGWLLKA